ncbi:hypothetical protein [Radiobacillus sp. PE A8.2]|uniref:hypothetical protein n=1 Tax=Radiobacillus sp. PE A8.2 TaxID=3380349 RepID=UPI0038900865
MNRDIGFDRKNALEKTFKQQKIALKFFLSNTYLVFIGIVCHEIQAIADFNYILYEMISSVANLMFLIPALLLVYMFYGIKYLRIRGLGIPNFKTGIRALFIVVTTIAIFSFTYIQINEVATSGVILVQEKLQEDNKYYLVTYDKKIEVTEHVFKLTSKNEKYMGSYKWNHLSPTKAKLTTIEPY